MLINQKSSTERWKIYVALLTDRLSVYVYMVVCQKHYKENGHS